ncbi:P-loop containing nucleoside triphosphate hydrolase protein [Thozetella sp. PMI_491]|nr:P-loop containing nucleoside triphosphate hydrolase protein [Thozetella sp. PMI_491]
MQALISAALSEYPSRESELSDWKFCPPYRALVHCWDQLKAVCANAATDEAKQAGSELISFLKPEVAQSVKLLAKTRSDGKIGFERIWQIFPPGEVVVATFYGAETLSRVKSCQRYLDPSGNPHWLITIEHIDWNGELCGYTSSTARINSFEGFRRVGSLPVYPVSFADSPTETKATAMERGRKFEALRGCCFRNYIGTKIDVEKSPWAESTSAGRVIVDSFTYFWSRHTVKPPLRPLVQCKEAPEVEASDVNSLATMSSSGGATRNEDLTPLTDEQCLLATPWVRGYELKSRTWGLFHVDHLTEIAWNDQAFDRLVLPGDQKELAWRFVESKGLGKNNEFDDFIEDKGRGVIILMFGPPGVGKTYTAEAVAERARAPLYQMNAGMLGTNPNDVETELDRALKLCEVWNAMLLIDEADIFLGTRTNDELSRNELVAIFLTKLEYYRGICFLTTNRITRMDHAFQSRVDLFLPYQELTNAARRQVWDNFIDHIGRDNFDTSEKDLEDLAGLGLNGREIRNLVKGAHLLSLKEGNRVSTGTMAVLAQSRVHALAMLARGE